MKPIQLSVAGLHSFREKQIINFDSLCDGGIFGIFGPTGSGKSSILDAMTLALYGKVERALNNTHGILNHAEDQLTVAFTFELENASVKKRYTVERVFKRSDEIRVKSSICRLIEVGDETIVLADKAVDVNEKVYRLLGLTIDDFTRAVVLPQGKFAEFLSLKGAERRQMLQRLFHLEQYGDQLMKKLKNRLTTTKINRNELEAEKTGLGDASSEAVNEAKERLKEAELLLKKRNTELEDVTREYEEKQSIWQLQQQKAEIEKQKSIIEAEKDSIGDIEGQLKHAEEAESLRPYAELLQSLKQEKREAEISLVSSKKLYLELKEQYEKTSHAYEEIRKTKAEQEPILVTKRERLFQLEKVENDLKNEQKHVNELKQKNQELQEQYKKGTELLTKAQVLVEKALTKQQLLKEEQKEKSISAKDREHIRSALEVKQKVKQNHSLLTETTELVNKKEKNIIQEKQKRTLLTEELTNRKKQLQEHFIHLNQLYSLTSERDREHVIYIHFVKSQLDDFLAKEEKAKNEKLAQELVKQLSDGKPCPVCGSCSHPSPIHLDNHGKPEGHKQSDQVKVELERLQALNQESHSIKIKLEGTSQQLVSNFPFLHEVKQVDEIRVDQMIPNNKEFTVEQGYSKFHSEYKGITQEYLKVKDQLEKSMKQFRELEQEVTRRHDIISSATEDTEEWVKKKMSYKQEYEQELEAYSIRFATIPLEEVEQLQKEIVEKDEAFETLSERIHKSVAFIEEQEAMVKEQERKNQQLTEKEIELHAAIKNGEQLIVEKLENLKEIDSDKQIRHLIEETEAQLKQLTKTENELYQLWQQRSNQLHQLQSQLAVDEKTTNQTIVKLEAAEKNWQTVCENTSFKTTEETLASLLSVKKKLQMKERIEQYSDKLKQVITDLHRIEEKLSGKRLEIKEWNQIQQIKAEIKEQVEDAVAGKGAADHALKVLLEKHGRFMDIENQSKELDDMLTKLEKLQSVFKGNSFVEYVAEEQLEQVSRDASERLSMLTRGRYAIEVDSQGGFIMRDDANGGVKRPVSSLSGGETFLTSLALALSLSTQIQLRGEFPLQFFFLDEGFGTLDVDLLDTVISALEKLQAQNLSVGVISHVQELRARLPRKLIVVSAEPSGKGTTVYVESI